MPDSHHNLPPGKNLDFLNPEAQAELDRWRQKIAGETGDSAPRPAKRPETARDIGAAALVLPINELIDLIKPPAPRARPIDKKSYSRGRGL